jgi:signal transduction histidine kinase
MLRPKLGQVQVETDLTFRGEVVGSPYTLGQVVVNLLENAIHATNGKGTVGISTRRGDHSVELEVWDNGPGIPADIRERIFEPFFSTKSPGEGTGLGLAICRQIAERYGGTLNLQPSPSGARFRLTLPQEQA